ARGRLVHDDEAGAGRERLRDLDHLLVADGQARQERPRRDLESHGPEEPLRLPLHPSEVEKAAPPRLATQKEIGCDVEVVAEVELLVNEGDPEALRGTDRADPDGAA